jgi:group I intron endonuclease
MHIYKITNLINNKVYIGQTIQKNPKMRWYAHLNYAKNGVKGHLYDSIRKHGIENFKWEILQKASDIDELNILETYWKNYYRNQNYVLYNNRATGNNKMHSEQSKKKMSLAQKEAHARRKSEGKDTFVKTRKTSGWKHSEESRAKRKEWLSALNRERCRGKTWKVIDSKRVWLEKEAAV